MQMSVLSATLYNKGFNSGKREVKNVCEVTYKKKKMFLKFSSLERRGNDKRIVLELKF